MRTKFKLLHDETSIKCDLVFDRKSDKLLHYVSTENLVSDNTWCEIIFYYIDWFEVSRSLPGAKDYKSVKDASGKHVHKQKSLLLMNLTELYEKYKSKYPDDKKGLSKFCFLRPPQCITVGCRGTHSVCVCTIRQNTELMISDLPIGTPFTYRDIMSKLMCSLDSKLCTMHMCASCPNKDSLVSHLEDLCDVDSVQ